ncbi:EamA family transporter [Salipaludibacillus agaradhaerens]|uniref:EamA family transporter n=1 Tax=Salipaludibacillus agaradhaerens TaxID=76935 RepID=A0A9Q4B4B9_SALAG|nr:DMT family transporter [Salipaludibacillus agaradhaerens]MCR6097895.1 EamA family transporter [Salipaludibacillus agaradhaerens]MCR6116476.1 EamA family transporter [Salipaludibacillus agaradhaerens]
MNKLSFLLVLLGAILWGTTGTAQHFAPDEAHPVAVGTMRLAVGGTVLFMIGLMTKKVASIEWPVKAILLAACAMAAYQPLFFSAVATTGVAIGTVVAIGSAPLMTGLIEWIVYRRRPIRQWWIATSLSILGCILLFVTQGTIELDPMGFILALGAGLAFSTYTLVNKDIVKKVAPEMAVAVVFTIAAIILSPLLFVFDVSWVTELNGLLVVLQLGIVATAIAYLLFVKGLMGIPASTAVTLSLAEPLTAALLGVALVGEVLTLWASLGVFLIFAGLAVLIYTPKKAVLKRSA